MCKLFILTNSTRIEKKSQITDLVETTLAHITGYDRDGFGYAIMGEKGVFGERYNGLDDITLSTLKRRSPMPEKYADLFRKLTNCERFGEYSKPQGSILIHARASTNSVCLENAHPHWNDQYTLIHNGVVNNEGKTYEMKSKSCDSEHLLHHLTNGGLPAMVTNITGYYAVGVINNKSGELLIVKDDVAKLYGTYIPKLDTLAFATSREHIESVCRDMGWTITDVWPVEDNTALKFSRLGAFIGKEKITPKKKTYGPVTTYSGYDNYSRGRDDYYNNEWKSKEYYSAIDKCWKVWDSKLQMYVSKVETSDNSKNLKSILTNDDCDQIDRWYKIGSPYGKTINCKHFIKLPLKVQDRCTITVRDTGDIVPIDEFNAEVVDMRDLLRIAT